MVDQLLKELVLAVELRCLELAKVVKAKKGFNVVHAITGVKLGHRKTRKEAQKLARIIRKRNR